MIKYKTKLVEEKKIEWIVCAKCGAEHDDIFEIQEALIWQMSAGFGSIFGDMNHLELVLCQKCVKELLGQYIIVTEPPTGD